jgi:CRP-like cAMP-binding protein
MSELARIEIVVLLQSVDLFSYCKADEILRISSIATERSVAAGDRVYEANARADNLYCVVRGGVVVTLPDGAERRIRPLEAFGVEEILSGRLREGSATATEDSLLVAMDAEDFFDLLANNVDIVKALFRKLVGRGASAHGEARS